MKIKELLADLDRKHGVAIAFCIIFVPALLIIVFASFMSDVNKASTARASLATATGRASLATAIISGTKVYFPQEIDSDVIRAQYLIKLLEPYTSVSRELHLRMSRLSSDAFNKGEYYILDSKTKSYSTDGFVYMMLLGDNWVFDIDPNGQNWYIKPDGTKVVKTEKPIK